MLKSWLGFEIDPVSLREKLVSTLGGLTAIVIIIAICQHALQLSGATMLIASMGASAVLLFAVPHGPLSQPWPVFAGHLLSAVVGVTCAKYIPNPMLAAGCAVGLAIGLMHQFKCIHPPGGATALTAVSGGSAVKSLGYAFVWNPVLLNVLSILVVAVVFNFFFKWRLYPAFLNPKPTPVKGEITHAEVVAALRSLDSFIDINENDLVRLVHILERKPGSTQGNNSGLARATQQAQLRYPGQDS